MSEQLDSRALLRIHSEVMGGRYHLYPKRLLGWHLFVERIRNAVSRMSSPWEGALIIGIVVGLYAMALAGASLALWTNGSLIGSLIGVPMIVGAAAMASHFAPPRPMDGSP